MNRSARVPRSGGARWRRWTAIAALALAAARAEPPRAAAEFDLRLRYVCRDEEKASPVSETRLRLEARWEAAVTETLTAVVALGTSREGAPVSAEVTLGEDLGDKPIALRTASLAWRPETAPDVTVLLGKLEPPWARASDLIWDDDLRPEGGAARWRRRFDSLDLLAVAGAFVLRDDHDLDGADRAYLYAVQAAARRRWPDRSFVMLGAGAYPTDGRPPVALAERGASAAPAVAVIPEPAPRYRPVEAFAAGTWELYFPVRGIVHYVVNPEADRAREGWLAGLAVGRTEAVNGLEIDWRWRRIESDAVMAAFADDTLWAGTGRAEHRWRISYRPFARLLLALVWSEGRRLDATGPDRLRAVTVEARAEF